METRATSQSLVRAARGRVLALTLGLIACAPLAFGCSGETTVAEKPSPTPSPGQAGMQAYIDPATGKLTDKRPPGVPPLEGDVRIPQGAYEEKPSPAPGGGVMIDLREDRNEEEQ